MLRPVFQFFKILNRTCQFLELPQRKYVHGLIIL